MRLIDADALSRDFCPGETYRAGEIQNVIDAAPTIEGERWIGADKRPKKSGKYIVYGVTMFVPDHNGQPCGHWKTNTANCSDKWGWDCKVKYWRPLPEPPKEDATSGNH